METGKGDHFQKILAKWLDATSICHSLTSSNQINEEWNSCPSQLVEEWENLFHGEKPWVLFFTLLSMKLSLQFWYNGCYSSFCANICRSHSCFPMNRRLSCCCHTWTAPVVASSSSQGTDWSEGQTTPLEISIQLNNTFSSAANAILVIITLSSVIINDKWMIINSGKEKEPMHLVMLKMKIDPQVIAADSVCEGEMIIDS